MKKKSKISVDKVKKDYNDIATEWDLSRYRPSMLKLKMIEGIEKDMKILDLGCGNGLMTPFILEKGAFYFGIDISEKLIEIAEKKYSNEIKDDSVQFLVGDVTEENPFDFKFDFIISYAVLHHIPTQELREKYFMQIKNSLKKNGKVKIIVWNLMSNWNNKRFSIDSKLNKDNDFLIPWKATSGKVVDRYVHQFSKEELYGLAANCGFKNIEIEYYNRAGDITENGEEIVLELEA